MKEMKEGGSMKEDKGGRKDRRQERREGRGKEEV